MNFRVFHCNHCYSTRSCLCNDCRTYPIYGLFAAFIPQFIHVLIGTSWHPAVGPVALDSLIVTIALGALSITKVDDIITAVIFLAAMV
ncbi:MAG: SulP family inorganic anion transporter [Bacteroidota bacterium]|nr:SulP family inorganic anion transporter [Bacteroidota bacterium]MEC8239398.1 SulP family inorganic anion transporter [Bacteroidota bacterium]MEC8638003.1 SulP family inorganic anion transporter [Bacteroidota bacterium]